jgi:hypothetical protein
MHALSMWERVRTESCAQVCSPHLTCTSCGLCAPCVIRACPRPSVVSVQLASHSGRVFKYLINREKPKMLHVLAALKHSIVSNFATTLRVFTGSSPASGYKFTKYSFNYNATFQISFIFLLLSRAMSNSPKCRTSFNLLIFQMKLINGPTYGAQDSILQAKIIRE